MLTTNIRALYNPIQPTATPWAEHVLYHEFLPDPKLQPFIYCYWQLKTTQPLSEHFQYRVVANGCMDIYFELDNPQENYVMGFYKKYTEFPLGKTFNYVGVRFLPTMFPQLFGINAMELSNRTEHLQAVVPALSSFISNYFNEYQQPKEIKTLLDNYFLHHRAKTAFNMDNRLYNAIEIILKNVGMLEVEKELNTGISPRQLRRIFEFYIGDTAKTFSQIVRFQNFLKVNPADQNLRQNKLFFDLGYYDHSHFIKQFKNFYGVTPRKAFRK